MNNRMTTDNKDIAIPSNESTTEGRNIYGNGNNELSERKDFPKQWSRAGDLEENKIY